MSTPSKRLEKVLEAAKAWSTEKQDGAAALLNHLDALGMQECALSDDERADLEAALG